MKQIFFITAIIALMACTPTPPTAPTPVTCNCYFVPIWQADTMLNGYRINPTDTIVSFAKGDTSCILYDGDTLFVFGRDFDTTKTSCVTAWVGPDIFDTTTAYSRCVVRYARYWETGDNKSVAAHQALGITTRYPNFATTGDAWYIGR